MSSSTINPQRAQELSENLAEIRQRVAKASSNVVEDSNHKRKQPLLVAVSKYKPSSDILACYENGQRDFGENYVQELVDKAKELPSDIRWHFIGAFQTNKAKILAAIPNLHAIQTIASIKAADAINKALTSKSDRGTNPLNVLIQVNTSGEDVKSGLPPLPLSSSSSSDHSQEDQPLVSLALHIINNCSHVRLQGLMTIGSLQESLSGAEMNKDFVTLRQTRDALTSILLSNSGKQKGDGESEGELGWGEDGRLLLSMGMSSDFEAALKAESDIVRVGTGIFGERHKKGEN